MTLPHLDRTCLLVVAMVLLGLTPARALINLDGTRNQIFVFGTASVGWDSNVFSDSTDRGDRTVSASVGADMKRRAGIIAVNASATLAYQSFGRYHDENAFNPNFHLEFIKATGRTTGQLTVSAFRESRSDSAVNLRTNSWNFPVGLSLKYPVNDKYYLTSQTTYLRRRYVETTSLSNYRDYSEAIDVFYVYTSKLDLVGGYRIRVSQTASGNDSYDHWFNLGATGGLFAKLTGSVRLGYQVRNTSGLSDDDYSHFNVLAALTWPVTRKLTLAGQIARDFNTIATGASVDSTSASLRASYSYTRKLEFTGGLSLGRNHFLGTPPPTRRDTFVGYDLGAHYRMNDHLQVGATFTYFRNQSSLDFSDFDRQAFAVDVTSRY